MRDIFSELINDLDNDNTSPTPLPATERSFVLPEGAKPYLPANILQKLTESETPRRGILLNALDRVRSVLYLISTYLPQHIVQHKMRRPVCGQFQGQQVHGTLLFSDVSGFTALSEKLADLGNEGAERLTQIMNGYFENMLEILARSGGILLKFAGDATLIYFAEQPNDQQAQWAVRTGQRMMAAMSQFEDIDTPLGLVSLKMKIGISTGHFLETHIGSPKRMEYVIIGQTVNQTMTAEGLADAGMIIVDQATAAQLNPATYAPYKAEFLVIQQENEGDLGEFEVKAESRRARGSMPWNANPHAIAAQMEVAVRQINALTPYLAQELVHNIVTNARKRQIGSEFRPTTIIFCNFTGFESFLDLWGNHGPRRIAKMLSQFFQSVHQIIARYGGVITRIDPYSDGSKMLILFGAPVAHEDDPQRAANAALTMQSSMADLNQEWLRKHSRQLPDKEKAIESGYQVQLKIGITHGRTFAGQVGAATRREYTVMGDDVNLSARLMSAAKPGQILLNTPVYKKIEPHFKTARLDPIRVKGKSEPIQIFELKAKREALANHPKRSQNPIFGRLQELAIGQTAIEHVGQGRGQLLQVQGSAGIGKSHLVDALYAQAKKESVKILLSYCHSFSAQSPYALWISLIRKLAVINESDSPNSASRKLTALLNQYRMADEDYSRPLANLLGLRFQASLKESKPVTTTSPTPAKSSGGSSLFSQLGQKVSTQEGRSRSTLDLSKVTNKQSSGKSAQLWQQLRVQIASREQARLFEAIFHLLTQLAAQQPLLLLFENAQWLDPASQELLSFIAPKLEKIPLLVFSIHRDSPKSSDEMAASQLNLGPLSLEATAELINHQREEPLEANLIQAIHTQSNGNPLFIQEMVYWLQRNQQEDQGKGLVNSLMASLNIQELILSRVDSLPLEAREILKTAAIIGNEFENQTLQALLLKQKSDYDLSVVLEQLIANQLITERTPENVTAKEIQYAFQQPLVREIIYNSQSFAKRRESHHALAIYIEKQYQTNSQQQVELLAYHFDQAEDWLKAGHYLFIAANQARQRFAYPLAAITYGRALETLIKLPTAKRTKKTTFLIAHCHEGQGDMALLTGQMPTAVYAYLSAANSLSANQQSIPTEIQIKLAQTLPVIGGEAESEILLRALLEQPLSKKHETAVTATLTWLLWRAEKDEAAAWLDQTKTLLGELPNDGWAAGILALLTEWSGNWEEALEAYHTLEQSAGMILMNCRLGDRFLGAGDFEKAQTHYQQAVETLDVSGELAILGLCLTLYRQAEADWRLGNRQKALNRLSTGFEKLPTTSEAERKVILEAMKLIEEADSAVWPHWHWRFYDDIFRISLLFNGELNTQFSETNI